ncbi:MAG: hypothetical protein V1672_03120 [Candidatus Diapherotrites archaeon]
MNLDKKILFSAVILLILAISFVLFTGYPFFTSNTAPINDFESTINVNITVTDTADKQITNDTFSFVKATWESQNIDIESQAIISSLSSDEIKNFNYDTVSRSFMIYKSDLESQKLVPTAATDFVELNIAFADYINLLKQNQSELSEQKETIASLESKEEICANLDIYETYVASLEPLKDNSVILVQLANVFSVKHPALTKKIHLDTDIETLSDLEIEFEEKKLFLNSWKKGCGAEFSE